jgi:hypothetical protein
LIFILSYDRLSEHIIDEMVFDDGEMTRALAVRVESEARYAGRDDIEVVLLRSQSAEALQRTHSRYFQSARDIASSLGDQVAGR